MLSTQNKIPLLLKDVFFMTVALSVFYALWIGSHALFTPDEGRYSEVAREMLVTHDFITPRLNGIVFLDKPIFYYWLQASAMYVFGIKEWALRFWPAFMGILGCVVTFIAGSVLWNRRSGFFAAMMLATSPLYYGAAHYANLDLEVAALIGSALLCFITGFSVEKYRTRFLIAAYIFCSLATLTKGMIGILFPAIITGAWIIGSNRWATLKKMHLLTGILLFLSIVLPWYLIAQKENPEFFHFFFVTQQVSRFLTTADFNNKVSAWFYLPVVFAGFFPWSVFILQAVFSHVKKLWLNDKERLISLFLLLWLFIIFIFFSIPRSKTVGYILPIFPALALLTGKYLDDYLKNKKGILLGLIIFSLLSTTAFITSIFLPYIHLQDFNNALTPYLRWMSATLFASSSLIYLLLCQRNWIPRTSRGTTLQSDATPNHISSSLHAFSGNLQLHEKNFSSAFCWLAFTASIFLLIMINSTNTLNEKSIKPLIMQLNQMIKPEDKIATYFKYYQDLPIYSGRRIMIVADWQAPDIANNDNWMRELWYGMDFKNTYHARDWLIDEKNFWQQWHSKNRLFVLMNKNYYDDFTKKSSTKIYKIAEYHEVILTSNQAST